MPARTDLSRQPAWSWPGVCALVLCAALWSLNGPLIKHLTIDGVDGLTIAFYRSLIGGLALLPLALPHVRTLRHAAPAWPATSVVLFTIMTASFVVATSRTAAANAIVLQYTSPIWVFLLAPLLLGERPRWADGLWLVVAMAGVGVIFLGHRVTELPWLAVALVSGASYGALTVALRGLRPVHPLAVACLNCAGSGLILAPAAGLWGSFVLGGQQFLLILLLSLLQFTLPYVLFSWALRRVEAHRAAMIVLLETVLNPLWTWLIIHEPVPQATRFGGPLIIAGVLGWMLSNLPRRAAPAASAADADATTR